MGSETSSGSAGRTIDKQALIAKYVAERDKRLRADGNAQYVRLTGGVGGTWYWNRYPGAQCDTASMIYMPLLEETGHMPSEKYAHAPEILAQCQRIGRQYGLYDNALFHTEVEDLSWDEAQSRWMIRTNRGDAFTASFIGLGTGPLHVPKLPGIPGIEDFKGHAFHTSRWDYDYTGGDPSGALMEKLADKRVAIIGTGATSVQAVPHLARACQALYVVQRTPSSVDVRANAPIDPDWFKSVAEPGWQQRWLENFTANQGGNITEVDLVMDGWTDLSRRIRSRINELPPEERSPFKMLAAFEDSDFEKMEEIRARVDSIVADTETAQKLKAWYRQLCKRPCFHDAYLQAFNTPGTHLVDTAGKGFVVAGVEYEVDCIIYASGFEVGTPFEQRAGFDLTGRGGLKLSEAWGEGMKSLHGIHVRDFPNAFFVQPTQGANLISNIPHNLTESGRTIAMTIRHALDQGAKEVEVTAEAQEAWVNLLLTGMGRMLGAPDCTPGYYNNEGQDPGPAARLNVGYPQGASAFFKYIDGWRNSGAFEGLAFR